MTETFNIPQPSQSPGESWIAAMHHLRDVRDGQAPMQHPGAPKFQKGEPYQSQKHEEEFAEKCRQKVFVRALACSCVGFSLPWLMAIRRWGREGFSIMMGITPIVKVPAFRWSFVSGGIGYMLGRKMYEPICMTEALRLRDSPLAKEARYTLWKMDPDHPLLLEDSVRSLIKFELEIAAQPQGTALHPWKPNLVELPEEPVIYYGSSTKDGDISNLDDEDVIGEDMNDSEDNIATIEGDCEEVEEVQIEEGTKGYDAVIQKT